MFGAAWKMRPRRCTGKKAALPRHPGQIMAKQKATVGLATGAQDIGTSAGYAESRTPDAAPTLKEAGINKNLAPTARTLASVRGNPGLSPTNVDATAEIRRRLSPRRLRSDVVA